MRGPWDGKQGSSRGFPIRLPGYGIFIFGVPKLLFFVKQLQGAHLSITRDLRVVVGECLRTTYHMPYARASHLGIPAASCGFTPNPLETDQIRTRGTLSVAQKILRKNVFRSTTHHFIC